MSLPHSQVFVAPRKNCPAQLMARQGAALESYQGYDSSLGQTLLDYQED
jgi:hypothetical protein